MPRPSLTLLTPTGDRPEAFQLLERWIGLQNFSDTYEWIVVDDGEEPTRATMGQRVLRPAPMGASSASQARNLREGLAHANSERIVIIEDDDYYAPGYLTWMARALEEADLVGMIPARYYNVKSRRYYENQNSEHASLAQTAVAGAAIPALRRACSGAERFIDLRLWEDFGGRRYLGEAALHVGLKALPGRAGIGSGHALVGGAADSRFEQASAWGIPEEYAAFGGWTITGAMTVVVLGNGPSRVGLDLEAMRREVFVIGCNAIYRDFLPDLLVSVDPGITDAIKDARLSVPHVYACRGSGQNALRSTMGWEWRDDGFESGPTAADVAVRLAENLREVYLVGVDLAGGNVYEGTRHYESEYAPCHALYAERIKQWRAVIERSPAVRWYWRPPPDTKLPHGFSDLPNIYVVSELPF